MIGLVALTRVGYDGNLGNDRAVVWQDSAACRGEPYQYFDYQESSTPLTEGMDFNERFEFNAANLDKGVDICMGCPVFITCGEEAECEDEKWTVRAGKYPMAFTSEKSRLEAGDSAKMCRKGHVKDGPGRCLQCKVVAMRRARDNAKREVREGSNGV